VYQKALGTGWHHYAVTLHQGTPTLYVDGELARKGLPFTHSYIYAPLSIGGSFLPYGHYQGELQRIHVYKEVLTAENISGLYAQEKDRLTD
jgi:hypothetical protein